MTSPSTTPQSRWPHRVAVVLVCATFPLLWVGGLVTTTEAGMAVPDWPSTFGYNLFLYPWQTWISGPWDLFIEHGHRLLGATVGLLCILMLATLWRCDSRRWVLGLGGLTLLAVILQGTLGGLRVIQNERTLAMVHGCFGPVVFALAVALAIVTSRYWRTAERRAAAEGRGKFTRLAIITTALAYVQLVLGAQLRHLPVSADPSQFRAAVAFHLLFAAVLTVHVVLLAVEAFQNYRAESLLARPAWLLVLLIAGQLALGAGVWITNYGWPQWTGDHALSAAHLTVAGGWLQTHVTTLHVALGSLILVTALTAALRSMRLLQFARANRTATTSVFLEVAV